MTASNLRPFVPSGEDFELAKRFFAAIGFETEFDTGDVVGLRLGDAQFLLQRFCNRELQDNFMVAFDVPDVDDWWRKLESSGALDLPGVRAKPPTDYPWGRREIHLIDPAGVLWHIGTRTSPRS